MSDQLMEHFKNTLSPNLSGQREGYSTNRAIEGGKQALDNEKHIDIILLDLSKVFDTLPQAPLITTLKAYNGVDQVCKKVKNWYA